MPVRSLREFFRESVHTALANQGLESDEGTNQYVVNLLTMYARSERLYDHDGEHYGLRPLALMLADALDAQDPLQQQRSLQRLGDVSLFMAGFFARALARRLVDVDYYVGMGGYAYGSLAEMGRTSPRGQAFREIFGALSGNFQSWVDVLNEVSECAYTHTDKDILRLYEVWMKTGSQRAASLLRGLGVETAGDTLSRRQH
jgi:hypothetical protein